MSTLYYGGDVLKLILLCFYIQKSLGDETLCDLRPLGAKTDPLPPDNRFNIEILNIMDNSYIPNKLYTVRLSATDGVSSFIAFTISASGDTKPNEKNARKPLKLSPGLIYPSPDSEAKSSDQCKNSVIQYDITPKTSVEAFWQAPPKDHKCVTIFAVLAVKPDVWYNFEGPLSKRVCEDRRNVEDMQPMENDNCQVCEDAQYLLTFERIWSYNTHPLMYPDNSTVVPCFSDVVGASHSKNFYVYKFNSEASQGLKMLAEQGNTTKLEIEIRMQLGSTVRTIIKASGHPRPNMATTSIFRVTREHHLVSLVTAILPSPDWFLGVSNMEMCDMLTGTWAPHLVLNLYPLDAGTDSGLTFGSANDDTMPPQPIKSAVINKSVTKEQLKPFAKIRFELIRTYPNPACVTEATVDETEGERKNNDNEEESNEIQVTSPTPEEHSPDPESAPECPVTAWEDWLPCEGECTNGNLQGYQMRFRYHLVDGVAVGKYVENGPYNEDKEVSEYCLENYPDSETRGCEEPCAENEEEEEEMEQKTIKKYLNIFVCLMLLCWKKSLNLISSVYLE
ncbi:unnamed protein product [Danaus chrysippus]|uniref:(African queen) hypothetical protein n=1 Tax=Danaus chrysippus TaxID=151541 RepID=A0A8J2QZT8_9NEOP|nr:unnamed protein product [Danaus chrysippus]